MANPIKPLVFVGHGGVSDNVIAEVATALYNYELIKVSVLKNCPTSAAETAQILSTATACETVQIMGAKITLYKVTDKKDFEHLL